MLFRASLLLLASHCAAGDRDSFDLLRTGEEQLVWQAQAPAECPECPPCPGGNPTPSPTPGSSIADDPHIRNLAQESFSVNQPGDYVLLRVPREHSAEALLEVRGQIQPSGESACKMYTVRASLQGKWLGDKVLHVRPLRRTVVGSNTGGDEVWPLSVMVAERGADSSSLWTQKGGSWKSFQDVVEAGDHADIFGLPDMVQLHAFHDQAFGAMREGETLQFLLGSGAAGHRAKINVAQASHQALNINLQQAKMFGTKELGGLLGTEHHDAEVEKLTDQCRKQKSPHTMTFDLEGSFPSFFSQDADDGDFDLRPSVLYSWWN